MPNPSTILALFDAGNSPAQIAASIPTSLSTVYAVLREHRPDRPRAPRPATSDKVPLIRGLLAAGHSAARVAELAGVSRAYVYRLKA